MRNQKCNQMTQEFHIRFSTHAYYFSDRNISYFRRFFRKWKSPFIENQAFFAWFIKFIIPSVVEHEHEKNET